MGFSILETLVAFALVAMVLAVFYRTTGTTLVHANQSLGQYQRTELAKAVLDEYLVLPDFPNEGEFGNRWVWKILISDITDIPATRYDTLIGVKRITVEVSERASPNQKTVLFTERIMHK